MRRKASPRSCKGDEHTFRNPAISCLLRNSTGAFLVLSFIGVLSAKTILTAVTIPHDPADGTMSNAHVRTPLKTSEEPPTPEHGLDTKNAETVHRWQQSQPDRNEASYYDANATIPHKIFIAYKHDLLKNKKPKHYADNAQKTASKYRNAWEREARARAARRGHENDDNSQDDAPVPVNFLTDHNCGVYVARARPDLVPHYYGEANDSYKAHVCTICALYLEGGYAFSSDVEIVTPFVANETLSFVAVVKRKSFTGEEGQLFEGAYFDDAYTMHDYVDGLQILPYFLASVPKHPILHNSLERIVDYYHGGWGNNWAEIGGGLGPSVLTDSYFNTMPSFTDGEEAEKRHIQLLEEVDLSPQSSQLMYPNLPRRKRMEGQGNNTHKMCNEVVHDPERKQVHFYTRIEGSALCPFPKHLPKVNLQLSGEQKKTDAMIPRILWFTYKHDILESGEPKHLADNVRHTITSYRKAWKDPTARAIVLDDEQCASLISEVEPDLVPYFFAEGSGAFRSDVCRISALYLYGGYYHDVDMETVEPFVHAKNVSFATALNPGGEVFFQSFLASSPKHPVLLKAMQLMLLHYKGEYSVDSGWLGPRTLIDAFYAVQAAPGEDDTIGQVSFLREAALTQAMYPTLPRRVGRDVWCNHIVHDPAVEKVYFFSRIVGSSHCPFLKKAQPVQ